MLERVEERFDLKPARLIGDMAYGAAPMLGWLVDEKQIAPHIPVWDRTQRDDETLSSSDFQWDEAGRRIPLPAGQGTAQQRRTFKNLRTHITKAGTIIYRASQSDCASCPLKPRCCPNTPMRKIARSVHESARDVARDVAKTDAYKQSRKDRKKVEMLFAHLKRILKLDRLRLRGPSGAHDEFLLAAIAQNLRRMAKRLMFASTGSGTDSQHKAASGTNLPPRQPPIRYRARDLRSQAAEPRPNVEFFKCKGLPRPEATLESHGIECQD